MRLKLKPAIGASALVLAAINNVYAQYTPPAPLQPFPGFVNDALRKKDPYYSVWDIGGSYRARFEVKENGLGLPPANDFRKDGIDNDNSYLSQKVLARVAYTDKWWSAYVEGRSSTTSGDDRTPKFEKDGPVDLHQAYVTVGNHKEFPVSIKVGRQELSYGDERLVGAFGWHNIGRVFDSAKLRWQNEYFAAEAFSGRIVLPNHNNFNVNNEDSLFSGVHLTTKKLPKVTTEAYFFAKNDDAGSTSADTGSFAPFQVGAPAERNIYTFGGRFKSNPGEFGNFDFTVEGAYQIGDWKQLAAGPRVDHEAYAGVVNVGYTFGDVLDPYASRLALEYAYATGDSNPTDSKHETFENLYPTNHKFYGYMDFLSWQNLHDVRLAYTMKPHARMSLAVEGHMFWLADTADSFYNVGGVARGGQGPTPGNGYGRNPTYDSYVGSEIDLVAGFIVTKYASVEAGYGHFFRGDYIKQSWSGTGFGSRDADWCYIQTVIRF